MLTVKSCDVKPRRFVAMGCVISFQLNVGRTMMNDQNVTENIER